MGENSDLSPQAISGIDQVDAYLNNPKLGEKLIQAGGRKEIPKQYQPENHPYLLHIGLNQGRSPQRDAFIQTLEEKVNLGGQLEFADLIAMWNMEQNDYRNQFQGLNAELSTADTYFNAKPDESSVAVYVFTDGSVNIDPKAKPEGVDVIDKRIYQKEDMETLHEHVDKFKRISGGDGVSVWIKGCIQTATDILQGKETNPNQQMRLVKLINQQKEKLTEGRLRDAFDNLSIHAGVYISPKKPSA